MKPNFGTGYKSLAEHLMQFQSLGHKPMGIDINRLDNGDGIGVTVPLNYNFTFTRMDTRSATTNVGMDHVSP